MSNQPREGKKSRRMNVMKTSTTTP